MSASAPSLALLIGGQEQARQTFARDLQMLMQAIRDQRGYLRLWRAYEPSLSLGRFHRRAPGSPLLVRRMSGGRIVPLGPGVQALTLAVPCVDWLDAATAPLRPDQVLNRALRPLLEALRTLGVDVFYPGRDLVTARGRTLAHASFTVLRDGAALIEMHVAESASFAALPQLLREMDPGGVAAADTSSMESALCLAELGIAARSQREWAELLAQGLESSTAGAVAIADGTELDAGFSVTADEAAWRDHQDELGPAEEDAATAAMPSMLGVVECSARMRGDRLTALRISGDVIAPFHTLDDLSAACEGIPFRMPQVRRVLARVLSQPRSFVLGAVDLDRLIERMAGD